MPINDNRIGFAIVKAIKHVSCWSKVKCISTVLDIDQSMLAQLGVEVLALDFDGVLASHGEPYPCPEVVTWLESLSFDNVCILSNKPQPIREAYFQERFPKIKFIKDVPKKPYPQGLLKIAHIYQTNIQNVLLVDDRLWTGVLASCLANSRSLYVTNAYANYRKRPVHECFFGILRALEKSCLALIRKKP